MLPSGLSNSGFLNYAVAQDSDSTLNSGFNVVRALLRDLHSLYHKYRPNVGASLQATQLLSVTIGLVVGVRPSFVPGDPAAACSKPGN